MSDVSKNFHDLINMTLNGEAIAAIEKYYADNVVMTQADGTVQNGKAAVLEFEKAFFGAVTEMRRFEITDYVIAGNKTFDISYSDMTHSQWGEVEGKQISVMEWEDGKVVKVNFYGHDKE